MEAIYLHKLKATKTKKPWRIGRGVGSGSGKTSGRGHKGQNARSGGGTRLGFEGGQTPLSRRIPIWKRLKFNNNNKSNKIFLNLKDLPFSKGNYFSWTFFLKNKLVKKKHSYLKILGNGEIPKNFSNFKIEAHAFSETAKKKIIACGGEIITLKYKK